MLFVSTWANAILCENIWNHEPFASEGSLSNQEALGAEIRVIHIQILINVLAYNPCLTIYTAILFKF